MTSDSLSLPRKYIIVLIGLALHVLISLNVPLTLLADNNVDDQLYMKLAGYMLKGAWLGPYDGLTLQKGIGAPLFIALSAAFALPFRLFLSLSNGLAISFLALGLRRLGASKKWVWAAWAMAIFSPHYWDSESQRVSRDLILGVLSTALIATLIWMIYLQKIHRARFWVWGLAAGGVWGWLWMTREESVWSLLPVGLLCLVSFQIQPGRRFWQRGLGIAMVGIGFFSFMAANSAANLWKYGTFDTIEVWQEEFKDAYGSLARVLPAPPHREIVVSLANIEKIRKVSISFDRLMTFFPKSMANFGCQEKICKGEYSSGWWMTGLRIAMSESGMGTSGATAKVAWRRISDEVNRACETSQLECGPWRRTLVPAVSPLIAWQAFLLGTKNFFKMLDYSGFTYEVRAARGSPYLIQVFSDLLSSPAVPNLRDLVLRAELHSPEKAQLLSIDTPTEQTSAILTTLDSKSVDHGFLQRLELRIPVTCDSCVLKFKSENLNFGIPIVWAATPNATPIPVPEGVRFSILRAFSAEYTDFLPVLARAKIAFLVVEKLRWLYQYLIYIWLALGLFAAVRFRPRRSPRWTHAIYWGLFLVPFLSVYARLGIFALVEVTSFKTTYYIYFLPLYPLLLMWPAFPTKEFYPAKELKK